MIVVKVELWSAITGRKTEIARMQIANTGGSQTRGDYEGLTFTGRDEEALTRAQRLFKITRRATVEGHPRLAEHVWSLVAKMLRAMDYGAPAK